jgi:hypothetical protein
MSNISPKITQLRQLSLMNQVLKHQRGLIIEKQIDKETLVDVENKISELLKVIVLKDKALEEKDKELLELKHELKRIQAETQDSNNILRAEILKLKAVMYIR